MGFEPTTPTLASAKFHRPFSPLKSSAILRIADHFWKPTSCNSQIALMNVIENSDKGWNCLQARHCNRAVTTDVLKWGNHHLHYPALVRQ